MTNMTKDNTNYTSEIKSSLSFDTISRLPVVIEDKPIDLHHTNIGDDDDGFIMSTATVTGATTTTSASTPNTNTNTLSTIRPTTISKLQSRLMSVDSTSIDFDAIEMAANNKDNDQDQDIADLKYNEIDDNNINNNKNNSTYYKNDRKKTTTTTAAATAATPTRNTSNENTNTSSVTSSTQYLMDLYKQLLPDSDEDKQSVVSQQQPQNPVLVTTATATTTDLETNQEATTTEKNNKTLSWNINGEKEMQSSQSQLQSRTPSSKVTVVDDNSATTIKDTTTLHIRATRIPMSPHEKSQRIRLGICAMDKKARSKPMAEILSRLQCELFYVFFFGDHVILNEPITSWPICDALIAFFSKGYPLDKVKEYVKLRKPLLLNDLERQVWLQDRRKVYDQLEASGIDVPRHVYLSRDEYISTGSGDGNGARDQEVLEFDDHIEVNGISIHKPFVEKPVDAEDHNICIYYPTSAGGGCKKLFRKIANRSSEFYPNIHEVRRDGSYIYEEFVETQGTDVKMYSVGPEYGHAEARKSPAVDGKVERNQDGKEVRFPVILNFREKEISRRIVLVFKQFVCGFDILRVQEGRSVVSYVCDVNGWSFVKNSRKYYDDCAQVLSEHIICSVKPAAHRFFSTLDPLVTTSLNRESGTNLALACRRLQIAEDARSRYEDQNQGIDPRTGKKININELTGDGGISSDDATTTEISLKSDAATLIEGALPVREFPDNLTSEPAPISKSSIDSFGRNDDLNDSDRSNNGGMARPYKARSDSFAGTHQEELRCIIAIVRHGDRTPKQKLKINLSESHILRYFHEQSTDVRKELKVKSKAPLTEFLEMVKLTLSEMSTEVAGSDSVQYQLLHVRDILERWKIVGLNRKIQLKPRKFGQTQSVDGTMKECCTEVQLVLKWGGNLTKLGEKQSIQLGRRFRHAMYPDAPGGGILRLHSTFRHDLKIKTSDEGRVMKTAAAFAKGLLELEGDLPPILVSLVHKEKGSMHMLDPSGNQEVKKELDECKEKITANLQRNIDVATATEEDLELLVGPKELTSLQRALDEVSNPREALFKIHNTMGELLAQLQEMWCNLTNGEQINHRNNEHGEGVRGECDSDLALSGVKLYKGETLLELTERWRFIYDRLYDESTDTFDLSKIPDVHDNVRFDMLHNPHLGLTKTLQRLYEVSKAMADCVVPQEYGTTLDEKRSVGVQICHGLLEKVKYDLGVARTDNEVDMRYMINMEYAADLPINTMGRRIRTRLYFTSESHLHTVLNVFRFGFPTEDSNQGSPLLSKEGESILNGTPELCYLTHVVLRVFEDSRTEMMNDPRRYSVEILFSPGAHHTPLHMNELDRDQDASRFDTAPLQIISRDGLTCEEVEDFFDKAIVEGQEENGTGHLSPTTEHS